VLAAERSVASHAGQKLPPCHSTCPISCSKRTGAPSSDCLIGFGNLDLQTPPRNRRERLVLFPCRPFVRVAILDASTSVDGDADDITIVLNDIGDGRAAQVVREIHTQELVSSSVKTRLGNFAQCAAHVDRKSPEAVAGRAFVGSPGFFVERPDVFPSIPPGCS